MASAVFIVGATVGYWLSNYSVHSSEQAKVGPSGTTGTHLWNGMAQMLPTTHVPVRVPAGPVLQDHHALQSARAQELWDYSRFGVRDWRMDPGFTNNHQTPVGLTTQLNAVY